MDSHFREAVGKSIFGYKFHAPMRVYELHISLVGKASGSCQASQFQIMVEIGKPHGVHCEKFYKALFEKAYQIVAL